MVGYWERGAPGIEITRAEIEQCKPLVKLAQSLWRVSYHSWNEAFRTSNRDLESHRLIGSNALDRLRSFQSYFERLEKESRQYPNLPKLVEVLPENYPITARGRRVMYINRLLPFVFIDPDVDLIINMLLRQKTIKEDVLTQETQQKVVTFEDLGKNIIFLNRLGLDFQLEVYKGEGGRDIALTSDRTSVRIMPLPNGSQLHLVGNG